MFLYGSGREYATGHAMQGMLVTGYLQPYFSDWWTAGLAEILNRSFF